GPGHERRVLVLVVPRGADQHGIERPPLDRRIIPDRLRHADAPLAQRREQRQIVALVARQARAGRQRDAHAQPSTGYSVRLPMKSRLPISTPAWRSSAYAVVT